MYKIFVLCSAVLCLLVDISMNAMNAGEFATGSGNQYWLSYAAFVGIAVALAVNGPIFNYFGDKRAMNVAALAVVLSAIMSVTSVVVSAYAKANQETQVLAERSRLESELEGKDSKISECLASRYCVSEDMRQAMREREKQLAALPKNVVNVDTSSGYFKIILAVRVLAAISLPVISAELFRILGNLARGSMVVPAGSSGSKPRNFAEPTTKKPAPPRIPTDAEHEQIRAAYQALKREGHTDITVALLRPKARKSKSMVSWWMTNTDEETKMAGYEHGKNIVPISKVTKS